MIANDTRPGPANATMLICPVNDCPWRREVTKPEPQVGESMRAALRDAASEDHRAARAHLDEHPVDDFLRTIAELRDQLAAAPVV